MKRGNNPCLVCIQSVACSFASHLLFLISDRSSFAPLSIPQFTNVVNNCMEFANVLSLSPCQPTPCGNGLCLRRRARIGLSRVFRRRKPLSIKDFGIVADSRGGRRKKCRAEKYFCRRRDACPKTPRSLSQLVNKIEGLRDGAAHDAPAVLSPLVRHPRPRGESDGSRFGFAVH